MVGSFAKIKYVPIEDKEEEYATTSRAPKITMMNKKEYFNKYKNRHEFGFRKIGDVLIDNETDDWRWPTKQNVELTLRCLAKRDQHITTADIQIDQNPDGHYNVRIVDGGIGKEYIEILVIARNTTWLHYEARFYGNRVEDKDEMNIELK